MQGDNEETKWTKKRKKLHVLLLNLNLSHEPAACGMVDRICIAVASRRQRKQPGDCKLHPQIQTLALVHSAAPGATDNQALSSSSLFSCLVWTCSSFQFISVFHVIVPNQPKSAESGSHRIKKTGGIACDWDSGREAAEDKTTCQGVPRPCALRVISGQRLLGWVHLQAAGLALASGRLPAWGRHRPSLHR